MSEGEELGWSRRKWVHLCKIQSTRKTKLTRVDMQTHSSQMDPFSYHPQTPALKK